MAWVEGLRVVGHGDQRRLAEGVEVHVDDPPADLPGTGVLRVPLAPDAVRADIEELDPVVPIVPLAQRPRKAACFSR
jgi:hypothetical protein